jgi:streptomycin 6-kinase
MMSRRLLVRNGSELETRRRAKSDLRMIYTPRPDASPEGELTALANVYRFLLDRRERRDDDLAADGAEREAEHGR